MATDPAAAAYFAAVSAAGGTLSNTDKINYNTLFAGLRTDGLLSLLDRLTILGAPVVQAWPIDLISLTTCSQVDSANLTWTASQGVAGNGSSSYINTNIAPSGGTQFTQNSGSTGVYIRNARTTNNAYDAFGSSWLSFNTRLLPRFTDANLYASVNGSAWTSVAAPANVAGLWVLSRTAVSSFAVYINGSSFTTSSVASTTPDTVNIFLLASGDADGVTPHDLSADQIGMFYMGAGLDATQTANFTRRINGFFTAYGTNVFATAAVDPVPLDSVAAPAGGAGGTAHNPRPEVIVTIWVDDDEELPTETPATETVAPVTPYPKRKKAKKAQPAIPPEDDEEEEALMMLLAA